MSETITSGLEQGQTPLRSVLQYIDILKGENLQEYEMADGMLDDVLYHNTEFMRTGDGFTHYVINSLVDYQHRQLPERRKELNTWRKGAVVHVVRGMIQGKKFPLDQFDKAIPSVLYALAAIDDVADGIVWAPNKSHKRMVRNETMDVYRLERLQGKDGDPEVMKRAAEVFKYVGRPREYGRMMTRVARVEAANR